MKKIMLLSISLLFIMVACNSEKSEAQVDLPEGTNKIVVTEHMNGGGYTFIKGDVNGKEQWIAVREMPCEVGDALYYTSAMEMKNFESKSLNRTFPSILFVSHISKNVDGKGMNNGGMPGMISSSEGHSKPKVESGTNINVTPLSDGKTVETLVKEKASLNGKVVKIRGVVTKYNGGIMGKNWLHIQDGTKFGEDIDITVTSDQSAKVGETVIIEGTVTTDKDFGAGYFYDIIIENAKITVEEKI